MSGSGSSDLGAWEWRDPMARRACWWLWGAFMAGAVAVWRLLGHVGPCAALPTWWMNLWLRLQGLPHA